MGGFKSNVYIVYVNKYVRVFKHEVDPTMIPQSRLGLRSAEIQTNRNIETNFKKISVQDIF